MKRYRLVVINALLLFSLAGSMYGKNIENAEVKKTPFLSGLSIPFRDWKTRDQPLSAPDLKLLEPDDYVIRDYASPEGSAQLAIIAGHRKKSVHTPGFCMVGSGWDTITQVQTKIQLPGQTISATQAELSTKEAKAGQVSNVLQTYFFTDGDYSTSSLTRFQLKQLSRRFSAGIPLGAMVRITIPIVNGNLPAAMSLTRDFANATLPKALSSMRNTRLEAVR